MTPNVLFVGNTEVRLPLDGPDARKYAALGDRMRFRVLAARPPGNAGPADRRFALLHTRPQGAFYLEAALRLAVAGRRFRPDAVIAKSPYEALAVIAAQRLGRWSAPLVIELHGDWRTASRLYGSRVRAAVAPAADQAARVALTRCTGTRPVSTAMADLAARYTTRPALGVFPAFTDLEPFLAAPPVDPPVAPRVLWIGALQAVKGVRELAATWRTVAARVPHARLMVAGTGPELPVLEELQRDVGNVELLGWLPPHELLTALDGASLLLSTSRSEGFARVLLEAAARARPVVAPDHEAIRERFEEGVAGRLVPSHEPGGLAEAVIELLRRPEECASSGMAARAAIAAKEWTPAGYAASTARLVDRAREASRSGAAS